MFYLLNSIASNRIKGQHTSDNWLTHLFMWLLIMALSAENNNCFFIIDLNDEGNLRFKAIFQNDLYLEQVNYK